MLLTLPSELLQLVLRGADDTRDLYALCRVCKALRDVALPHLYETLVIPFTDNYRIGCSKKAWRSLYAGACRHGSLVRDVVLQRPFAEVDQERCMHMRGIPALPDPESESDAHQGEDEGEDEEENVEEEEYEDDDPMDPDDLFEAVQKFLKGSKAGALRSFR